MSTCQTSKTECWDSTFAANKLISYRKERYILCNQAGICLTSMLSYSWYGLSSHLLVFRVPWYTWTSRENTIYFEQLFVQKGFNCVNKRQKLFHLLWWKVWPHLKYVISGKRLGGVPTEGHEVCSDWDGKKNDVENLQQRNWNKNFIGSIVLSQMENDFRNSRQFW